MKNLLNNPWVVGGLCILAFITVYFRLFDSKKRPEAPVRVVQAQPSQVVTSAELPPTTPIVTPTQTHESLPITVGWQKVLERDPFSPRGEESPLTVESRNEFENEGNATGSQPMRLRAVFLEGAKRFAMINSNMVREGETIAGYVVTQITADRVLLKGAEEDRWLEFRPRREGEQSS